MKRVYFVRTNGYDMLITVDEEKDCRCLTETEDFPYVVDPDDDKREEKIMTFLNNVEDDSSWDEIDYSDAMKILEENAEIWSIEKEL